MNMRGENTRNIALIVAHPDDETLWAGGAVLANLSGSCYVLSLCRGSDTDRAPRFFKALKQLNAAGSIGDLNDGPEQTPLKEGAIRNAVLAGLPQGKYDVIYTHSPSGEYTRHLRHEETGREVLKLWLSGELQAHEINLFAYEDGNRSYLPRPIKDAHVFLTLSDTIWEMKYNIITKIYGFNESSFEAGTTPKTEAFWQIRNPDDARIWLEK